jgi:predicted proteasome-type protease
MTLIVGMEADTAIVLAADSRGTIGDPRGLTAINDTYRKISALGTMGIALAGASEMGNALLDELRRKGVGQQSSVDKAVAAVAKDSMECFRRWFQDIPPEKRPPVFVTVVGYRKLTSGAPQPMIYGLSSQMNFAPALHTNYLLTGIPQYAIYLVHRYYEPKIPLGRAKALAEYLITETASQDPKVGGPIRMAVVSPEGYHEIEDAEVQVIHTANNDLNAQLKRFFIKGA